ncbi:glycosyltransferase family 2 protein [Bacillus massilinigeriensis]|uniref:glycosyltransferase family 2 protein n=1 Tax=Bacillus mediterraneensis TaxID=1805474 RepID=UPI0008F95943|nr:glycosyltransferase family 2 protein [Bacillus mediterraneensis]
MTVKVSIIIAAYNTSKYIKKCIDSILKQTYENFEVIIVDDCSTDNTMEIIKGYQDSRIKAFINEENKGPSFSRNRAISLSVGEYIAILDSDDWWAPERLKEMLDFLECKNADIVFDNLLYIREAEEAPWQTYYEFKNLSINEPTKVTTEKFITWDLGILKAVFKKEILLQYHLQYEENVKYGEDFIFYLEILLKGGQAWLMPQGFYYYLTREGSLVTHMAALAKQCADSAQEIIGKYNDELNVDVKNALEERKAAFTRIADYYETDRWIRDRKLGKAINKMLMNPYLLKMVITIRLRKMKHKIFNQ